MRVSAPRSTEQGLQLPVTIEFRADPEDLPKGMRELNTSLVDEHVMIHFTHAATGQSFTCKPYDPGMGMPPAPDDGSSIKRLDRKSIGPFKVGFPLVTVALPVATYECRIEFKHAGLAESKRHQLPPGFERRKLWSGRVLSPTFHLEVQKETPEEEAIWIPTKLVIRKWEKGVAVVYGRTEAQQLKVRPRNGHVLGTYIYRDGQISRLRGGTPGCFPDDPNPIDQAVDPKRDFNRTYTIEIFEASNPPIHMWNPNKTRVLWKKTFRVKYSASELQKIQTGE
jgi:hypothetical protein